jgi:hypothetical protein
MPCACYMVDRDRKDLHQSSCAGKHLGHSDFSYLGRRLRSQGAALARVEVNIQLNAATTRPGRLTGDIQNCSQDRRLGAVSLLTRFPRGSLSGGRGQREPSPNPATLEGPAASEHLGSLTSPLSSYNTPVRSLSEGEGCWAAGCDRQDLCSPSLRNICVSFFCLNLRTKGFSAKYLLHQ